MCWVLSAHLTELRTFWPRFKPWASTRPEDLGILHERRDASRGCDDDDKHPHSILALMSPFLPQTVSYPFPGSMCLFGGRIPFSVSKVRTCGQICHFRASGHPNRLLLLRRPSTGTHMHTTQARDQSVKKCNIAWQVCLQKPTCVRSAKTVGLLTLKAVCCLVPDNCSVPQRTQRLAEKGLEKQPCLSLQAVSAATCQQMRNRTQKAELNG